MKKFHHNDGCIQDDMGRVHNYPSKTCPECGAIFCYTCCGSTNVEEGGEYKPDYMTCPVCGRDYFSTNLQEDSMDNSNYVNEVIDKLNNCKESYTVMDVCVQALAPIWGPDSADFIESCPVLDSIGVIEFTAAITKLMNSVYNELMCDDECQSLIRVHTNACVNTLVQYYNK